MPSPSVSPLSSPRLPGAPAPAATIAMPRPVRTPLHDVLERARSHARATDVPPRAVSPRSRQRLAAAVDGLVQATEAMRHAAGSQADPHAPDLTAQAARARLRFVRDRTANAYGDWLSPRDATAGYVDLVFGSRLLLLYCGITGTGDPQSRRVAALLAAMQLRQLLRSFGHADPAPDLQIHFDANAETAASQVPAHRQDAPAGSPDGWQVSRGTSALVVSGRRLTLPDGVTVLLHEIWHALAADSPEFPDRRSYRERPAATAPAAVIARSLQAARALPVLPDLPDSRVHYLSKPTEADAFAAQAEAVRSFTNLLPTRDARLHACGFDRLKPFLAGATDALVSEVGPASTTFRMRPAEGAAPTHLHEIALLLASLDEMAGSRAWQQGDTDALTALVASQAAIAGADTWGEGATRWTLKTLADALFAFHDGFVARAGLQAALPSVRTPPATAEAARTDPVARFQSICDGDHDATRAAAAFAVFETAKWDSGFVEQVEDLCESIRQGEPPGSDAVEEAIVALAGALIGLPAGDWPASLRPRVDLYAMPDGREVPAVAGFNPDAPGQRRRIDFIRQALQFMVPRPLLDETDRLEARLAAAAGRLAFMIEAAVTHDRLSDASAAAGLAGMDLTGLWQHLQPDLQALRPRLQAAAQVEGSAAHWLHRLLLLPRSKVFADDAHWHDGPRVAVEQAAREGDAAAAEVLMERRFRRSGRSVVAFTRAVKATTPTAADRARLDGLGDDARRVAGIAAVLGDAFSRELLAGNRLFSLQVPDADWQALHDRGLLRAGRVADPRTAALLKRSLHPGLRETFSNPAFVDLATHGPLG